MFGNGVAEPVGDQLQRVIPLRLMSVHRWAQQALVLPHGFTKDGALGTKLSAIGRVIGLTAHQQAPGLVTL